MFNKFPAMATAAAPFSVKVPVMVTSPPKDRVAAADSDNVPPPFMVTAPVNVLVPVADVIVKLLPVTPPPIVVVPDTVNVNAPTESDDNVVGSSITKVAQAAFAAFTVTMNPPPIFTTSPAIGKVPVLVELTKLTVDQVVLTFQAADALEK